MTGVSISFAREGCPFVACWIHRHCSEACLVTEVAPEVGSLRAFCSMLYM